MGEEREVLNVVVKCGPKGPRHRPQRADRLEAFLRPSRLRARRIVTPAVAPVQVPRPAHAQGLLDVVPPGRRVQAMLERDGVVQGEGDRGRAREVLHEERDDLLGTLDQDIAHGARWETRVLHRRNILAPQDYQLTFSCRLLALTILLGVKLRTNDEFGAVINA